MGAFFDRDTAQKINPDFDPKAYNFWSDFLDSDAKPVIHPTGQTRGAHSAESGLQPVFLHYDGKNFRNAAELDASALVPAGDVSVSVNTNNIKIAPEDQDTFDRLQNAQLRVDVAQKTAILPVIEAMAYTVVSGIVSNMPAPKTSSSSSSAKKPASTGSVQSLSIASDPAWQKMQNIILPGGEGRWALNLEAQKKDSLFFKVFQNVVKEAGQFAPVIGLPGIAMTALQSFNTLYGAIHAEPVQIIKSNPLRVFATQEAIQKTGAPGSVTGILLQSGTYILVPASKAPTPDDLKSLTVLQGCVVPQNTKAQDVEAAAAETLKDVTYVTFDVQVSPTTLFNGATPKKSA